MANEQHLAWLKEGVEAWNARRAEGDFVPNLRGADLRGADLREADLRGADLRGADLRGADLRGADLRGADFDEASVKYTEFEAADVSTLQIPAAIQQELGNVVVTQLGLATGLSQNQVDSMLGDEKTILPPEIIIPKHWPQFKLLVQDVAAEAIQVDAQPVVFLSYSFFDSRIVARVDQILRGEGLKVWSEIESTDGWVTRQEILLRQRRASVVVAFWNQSLRKSVSLVNETLDAMRQGKLILGSVSV